MEEISLIPIRFRLDLTNLMRSFWKAMSDDTDDATWYSKIIFKVYQCGPTISWLCDTPASIYVKR